MKLCKILAVVVAVAIGVMSLTSCATSSTRIAPHLQSPSSGFTSELDEPSARAQLTRVSPEQSVVVFRFDISPDAKHIIYSGVQSGGGDQLIQLWKISSDGTGSPVKITSGGENNFYYPTFTNDGEYIVYSSANQIWKVRSDGAGGKMLIPGTGSKTDTAPHISKDNILVFNSIQYSTVSGVLSSKYLIWTSNLNGGELTQIREGSNPRWSPDGKKIVFEHDNEIWIIDANGTSLIQLTNSANIMEKLPSFSPQGDKIVYTSNEGKDGKPSADWNIWTMDADGASKMQITELKSWDSWPIWGNDGIYFLSARAQTEKKNIQRIWKLKL